MARLDGACIWHFPSQLRYVAWHAQAEQRIKHGERQIHCSECGLWMWPEEFGEKPVHPASQEDQQG